MFQTLKFYFFIVKKCWKNEKNTYYWNDYSMYLEEDSQSLQLVEQSDKSGPKFGPLNVVLSKNCII